MMVLLIYQQENQENMSLCAWTYPRSHRTLCSLRSIIAPRTTPLISTQALSSAILARTLSALDAPFCAPGYNYLQYFPAELSDDLFPLFCFLINDET